MSDTTVSTEGTPDDIDVALDQVEQLASKAIVGVVIDQSGSMMMLKDATISGFGEFLEEQQRIDAQMVVTIFDSTVNMQPARHVKDVVPLTNETYTPQAMTALLDAIGVTIGELDRHPGRHVLCILTDGQENSSHEYNYQQINEMIEDRKSKGWEILFLGSSAESLQEAAKIGIAHTHTAAYAGTVAGTQSAYRNVTQNVASTLTTGASAAFTDDQRDDLMADES